MSSKTATGAIVSALLALVTIIPASAGDHPRPRIDNPFLSAIRMVHEGRETFRHDTFGNEDFWGGQLGLHRAIAGEANGGIGPGVSPATALAVGLKVDSQALPRALKRALRRGEVDLEDPATTLALLELDAIVGVKAFAPEGTPGAVLIPPAFGLAGVNLHTWTGWGSVTHWNAFVAVLEMQGKGTFVDPRLDDAGKFPIAAANGFGEVRHDPDLVTPRLAALQFYQLSLEAPAPPRGSFDEEAAERGERLFAADGQAACGRCHVPPIFTEPGWNLHTPEEIGIDSFQAQRGPENRYRTSPLKGLWTHGTGGYYHDGRFGTLMEVVEHYDDFQGLGLDAGQKRDLVEYLKSL